MTVYDARSEFGWSAFHGERASTTSGLVVHYDGSDQHLADEPHSECIAYWKATRKYHLSKGWLDIGYAYGACPHGHIFEGRGWGYVQAAQRSDPGKLSNGNSRYVSVTLMSGPRDRITEKQIDAVRSLRTMLMVRHGLKRNVYGHRDFSITDCPGNAAYGMVLKDVFEHLSTEYPALRETQPYTTGKAVRRAQKLLGFKDADIDGIYGPMTAAAVRRLKVRNKLSDDTTLGERAWMILLGI